MGDPNNPNRLYAAATAPDGSSFASTGVYVSDDTGAHWTQLFSASNSGGSIQSGSQTLIKIALGSSGAVAVGVVDLNQRKLTGLFLSKDSGSTWSSLPVPSTNPGGQAPANFAVAVDPNNPDLVYVSGDYNFFTGLYAVAAFRVDASDNTITDLTDIGTGPVNTNNGSTVHPDSRALVFDANGRLIITTDGGVYARTNPQGSNGGWSGLTGNLAVFEPYAVAYDGASKRLVVSAQDNGSSIQSAPGSHTFIAVGGGDGTNAAVNDRTVTGFGAIYTSSQYLGGLQRNVLDSNGNLVSPPGPSYATGAPVYCDFNDCSSEVYGASFLSPFVLNKVDPSRIALGGIDLYVTRDTLTGAQDPSAPSVNLTLTDLGSALAAILAIAYGARDNIDAIVAGTRANQVYFSASGAPGSLSPLPAYAGAIPTSLVFDARFSQRFFVADSFSLYGTTDQGATFQNP